MRPWIPAAQTLALMAALALCAFLITAVAVAAVGEWTRAEALPSPVPTEGPTPIDGSTAAEAEIAEPSTFTIYLGTTGSDMNSGRTADEPVPSLSRAQDLLTIARPQTNVEIRVAAGAYTAPPLTWSYFVPGKTITFLPVDDQGGSPWDAAAQRPVFQGNGASGFWLSATMPASIAGSGASLQFRNLLVRGYDRGGILLSGGTRVRDGVRGPASDGLNGNVVTGMHFSQLGSAWVGGQDGYAGIDLVNSSENVISGNVFVALENSAAGASLMHGVYLAHHSRANVVSSNYFERVSGDPVRARNDSNDNEIAGNVFQQTGRYAQFSDWFCDSPCAEQDGRARECASHGNAFHDNVNNSGYAGGALRNWEVFPAGLDYPGGPGCDNAGQPRTQTWGNT